MNESVTSHIYILYKNHYIITNNAGTATNQFDPHTADIYYELQNSEEEVQFIHFQP